MDQDLILSYLEKIKSCPPAIDVSVNNLDLKSHNDTIINLALAMIRICFLCINQR